MPKAILEYQLPEEQGEWKMMCNTEKYYLALWEIYTWLRNERKYVEVGAQSNLEGVWMKFHQILEQEGVDLP